MTGTALLINKDHTVTVLENVEHEVYNQLVAQEDSEEIECTINNKEVHLHPIEKVVWYEDTIDWTYGY
ncbi:hypothetical protein [Oceanobacillus halophilus]|uniref:Uncharacterized protein n=1 Tax=Oceanobacillus halophilus TaxID=930130 RepID=A0A494ZR35_9BACI|nr:hypothetical protein [Oceanobacillus halophilus]RKQ28175.1 hypothetical protein D8M06_19140 [Oceanobacillus halophilus]